jgi:hypothetical protein
MELSTGQQRWLFVVLVVLLAGLGIYLLGPGRNHHSSGGSPSSGSSGGTPSASATATPALAGVPSYQAAPTPLPVPTEIKGANIYSWLPFTQADLDAAANVTLAFAKADETFTYRDTPATYEQRLSSLVTPTLGQLLERDFEPPGAKVSWAQKQLVSTSAGTINSISSFGGAPQASITFLVTITEETTASGTTSTTALQYDVTAVQVAGGWQVNDIEPAGTGNQ